MKCTGILKYMPYCSCCFLLYTLKWYECCRAECCVVKSRPLCNRPPICIISYTLTSVYKIFIFFIGSFLSLYDMAPHFVLLLVQQQQLRRKKNERKELNFFFSSFHMCFDSASFEFLHRWIMNALSFLYHSICIRIDQLNSIFFFILFIFLWTTCLCLFFILLNCKEGVPLLCHCRHWEQIYWPKIAQSSTFFSCKLNANQFNCTHSRFEWIECNSIILTYRKHHTHIHTHFALCWDTLYIHTFRMVIKSTA